MRAAGVTQSSSVPPASFSQALKSPLTAVACGEEKDIFLPREEGEKRWWWFCVCVGGGGGGGREGGDMLQAV